MEDSLLDQVMEDSINGGYGNILDEMDVEDEADYADEDVEDEGDFDFEDGRYDDDPNPYEGTYSEE